MKSTKEMIYDSPNTPHLIKTYIKDYAKSNEPILVNFRNLVPEINKMDRYSHLIHSYPAKLLCHIPYFFLQTDYFCPKGGIVLDPFCGTGTVLLEALIAGKNAYGVDANPLARLITSAKISYLCDKHLLKTLPKIISDAQKCENGINSLIDNIDFWYHKSTIESLSKVLKAVKQVENTDERLFFEVCFSNLVKKVSYADPRISVPVKLNPDRFLNDAIRYKKVKSKLESLDTTDVYGKFEQICKENIYRLATLAEISNNGCKASVIAKDARDITAALGCDSMLADGSVDLILTSPPYAGAQKYIRSSRLNLGWLGIADSMELRNLDSKNIGRENYHKSDLIEPYTGIVAADKLLCKLYSEGKVERAHIVGNYVNEMKAAIDESYRVLKDGGYFIMIIGNNTVCGYEFDTQEYLTQYLLSKGLKLQFKLIDDIKSYGLMTKRNKTASRISCEWVLVLKKQMKW